MFRHKTTDPGFCLWAFGRTERQMLKWLKAHGGSIVVKTAFIGIFIEIVWAAAQITVADNKWRIFH